MEIFQPAMVSLAEGNYPNRGSRGSSSNRVRRSMSSLDHVGIGPVSEKKCRWVPEEVMLKYQTGRLMILPDGSKYILRRFFNPQIVPT